MRSFVCWGVPTIETSCAETHGTLWKNKTRATQGRKQRWPLNVARSFKSGDPLAILYSQQATACLLFSYAFTSRLALLDTGDGGLEADNSQMGGDKK